jgi:hypothetical protein
MLQSEDATSQRKPPSRHGIHHIRAGFFELADQSLQNNGAYDTSDNPCQLVDAPFLFPFLPLVPYDNLSKCPDW